METRMQNRSLNVLQLVLSLLLQSANRGAVGSGPTCLKWSPTENGQTRVTFLRENRSAVSSLYLTLWSGDMLLEACQVTTNPVVVESYRILCGQRGARSLDESPVRSINMSALLTADTPCALIPGAQNSSRRTFRGGRAEKRRRRRSIYFPGTLWCGTGSKAAGYTQLGMFESADRCCREHDQCLHIIPAFTVNYGVFNSNFYTISHCDCDQRFQQCLLGINDTISTMVGYSFFNILQVPCFKLKQEKQCTKTNWWRKCQAIEEVTRAVLQRPLYYNTSHSSLKYGEYMNSSKISSNKQLVTEIPTINVDRGSSHEKYGCSAGDPPRGDNFHCPRRKGQGCKRCQKTPTEAELPISQRDSTRPFMKLYLTNASSSQTQLNNSSVGKKNNTRKCQLAHKKCPNTTAIQSTSCLTQTPAEKSKTDIKVRRQNCCCGSEIPVRGETIEQLCRCQEQNTTSSTTTEMEQVNATWTHSLNRAESHQKGFLERLFNANKSSSFTAKPEVATTNLKKVEKIDSHVQRNKRIQELVREDVCGSSAIQQKLKKYNACHNVTDNQLMFESLRHLDECDYKIPSLGRNYNLQNRETKTAYHCNCTSRLAGQIESVKQPGILPSLLRNFVSQYCFILQNEKECQSKKSCSGGFTNASDLLQALKKIEEKDTSGVRNLGNNRKRGVLLRFYKRC